MMRISRRDLLQWSMMAAAGVSLEANMRAGHLPRPSDIDGQKVKASTFQFIEKCAREDGRYSPSPDSRYQGSSDTAESDLAAVTYAATLAKPEGCTLAHAEESADFIQHHQRPDGVFENLGGNLDPHADLAVLYNTVQGVVGLRTLGAKPRVNPAHVLGRFFQNNAFAKLPWYMVSFFPLFYAALGVAFPPAFKTALERHLRGHQAADGYLGDHVAATFHLVHFYRLIGQPTPKADAIVQRVLRDQRPDGGWQLKAPDWDVHSCFDAVFILRQLGGNSPACRAAIGKAAGWALRCQNADGGFGHYPGLPSDMDAVYFQFGTLIQAGLVPGTNFDLPDAETLSWGHVMQPGVIYRTT